MIKENCFAFVKAKQRCKALNKKEINCLKCNFYKTKKDFRLDQERVLKRLRTLDEATRIYIAERYKVRGIV